MKTALVTGATCPGIGEAITRRLLLEGWHVIGTRDLRNPAPSFDINSHGTLELIDVDHADRNSLNGLCQLIGSRSIDAFVNVQMYFNMENQENFDYDLWDQSLATNLSMPNLLVRTLKANFSAAASIVAISSTEAFIGSFGASAYAASKAAIHNAVKTWANLLGNAGQRVNAVAAGWIGGVMDTDEVFNLSREITPLGRLGTPDEVASVVIFLIGRESSFVNGSVITVDGGYSGVDRIAKFEFGRG